MWENPFGFGPMGILLSVLVSVIIFGVGLMNPPPVVTKACFCVAAVVLLGWSLWVIYIYTLRSSFLIRAGCVFLVFGLIGIGLNEALRLIDIKQVRQIPKVDIKVYPSPVPIYPPPLQEYTLMIQNINPDSAIIRNFNMKIYFQNIIVNVKSMPLMNNFSLSGISIFTEKQGKFQSVYEEQPTETPISKNFSLKYQRAKIDGKIVNTNILIFQCDKWPIGAAFSAHIVIDLSKISEINVDNPDKTGVYRGTYSYEISDKHYTKSISGYIPNY